MLVSLQITYTLIFIVVRLTAHVICDVWLDFRGSNLAKVSGWMTSQQPLDVLLGQRKSVANHFQDLRSSYHQEDSFSF